VTRAPEARWGALFSGAREALGLPALVLGASYVGFGSLVRESGLALWLGLVSTASGWALPGQVVVIELYGVGASLLAVALAVGLTNARLLPMAVTLMPLLRRPGDAPWRYYVAGHLVAVTGWAAAMLRCPAMSRDLRLPWFVGFAVVLWLVSLAGTAAGYLLAEMMPDPVTLGLVFLNPVYFMLLFAADYRRRSRACALAAGAVLGPLLHLLVPDWGLLLTGLAAGSFAFFATRAGHA
jgi:predicted branched-subunit amino acid permease